MITGLKKIDVAGLEINPIRKTQLLEVIRERVAKREKTFVVTPYSETLYASLLSPNIRHLLNSADLAVPDGVGVLWAHLFLSKPLTTGNFYLNIAQACWQIVWTGASILLHPSLLYKQIPEKIVGADLIWDLAAVAEKNNFSVFLLGALGNVAQEAAQKLKLRFPNLNVVGTSNKRIDDPTILDDINNARPDMLFVAFKHIDQEHWIADNLSKTTAALGIGLGGTFDYITGKKVKPPKFIRSAGLEWLWRLITQPSRLTRIYNGVINLIWALLRYKVYMATTFRQNACAVVVNGEGKVLLCKRVPGPEKNSGYHSEHFNDYWQFPQGGLDSGEEIIAGAQRELMEETGITSVKVLGQAKFVNSYHWNNARRHLVFSSSRYKHKGQEQYTVFFLFQGNDNEIKLDHAELVDYQWLHPDEVLKIIAPERRMHASVVLAELAQLRV